MSEKLHAPLAELMTSIERGDFVESLRRDRYERDVHFDAPWLNTYGEVQYRISADDFLTLVRHGLVNVTLTEEGRRQLAEHYEIVAADVAAKYLVEIDRKVR